MDVVNQGLEKELFEHLKTTVANAPIYQLLGVYCIMK